MVGAYSFDVPGAARQGDSYLIEIGRPTATSDAIGGSGGEVFIESVNASTNVTISERRYIAGDVVPFHWFNAGDFGENEKFENDPTYLSLRNNDVEQVFQSAIYQYGLPIDGSDFLDAMDSCCGLVGNADAEGNYPRGAAASINETNGLFSGTDSLIDSIGFGDDPSLPGYQRINVADVYVTFRRSIDPSLKWFQRFWHNGNIVARPVTQPIEFRGAPNLPAEQFSNADAVNADGDTSNEAPAVVFSAPDLIIAGGQKLTIPIQARVRGRFPIRVWMFNAVVEPLDGAPPLTEQVEFVPHGTFGRPTFTSSRSLANYGAAWLNPSIAGLRGDTQIGTLQVKLPPDLSPDAAYRVRFEHISASPNGLAVFPQQVQDGLLLGRSREASSFNDGIPDTWRLRYFGSVDNLLSHANADADGDGVSNWAEFKAGTNPVDVRSNIRVKALHKPTNNRGLVLRWPTAKGKTYAIEAASSITSREWTPVSPNVTGTGFDMQFNPADGGITEQFYRVRLVE